METKVPMGFGMGMELAQKGYCKMDYKIINVNGHYQAYINGEFVCSGDTIRETVKEVEEYLSERG